MIEECWRPLERAVRREKAEFSQFVPMQSRLGTALL
jgi:hypothetical protein